MRIINLASFDEEDLNVDEEIIFKKRSHVLYLFLGIFKYVFLLALTIFVIWNLILRGVLHFNFEIVDVVIWFVLILWILYLTFWIFLNDLLNWFFDFYVLTNERIVFLDQHYLFGKDVFSTELESIHETSLIYCGIFGAIFNYADIEVHVPSGVQKKSKLVMKRIYKARKIQNMIIKAIELSFENQEERRKRKEKEIGKDIDPIP